MKIIMGIDPGSYITGYGIIFQKKKKISYIGSGCIHTEIKDFFGRLKQIYVGINEIITKFKPNCLAIEQVFVGKNFNSALKLGHTRGVAIIAALNQALPIFEYASSQVKKTVVGIGSAKKTQVQYMVCSLLKLYSKPQLDASDALAIAITHSHISNNRISDLYL